MKILKKIMICLMAGTALWMVVYIVGNIYASFHTFTSFPWWSAFVFAAYYFLPALAVEGLICWILTYLEKRKQ